MSYCNSTQIIQLEFSRIDLELSPSCSYDAIRIFDGSHPYAPLIDRLCGRYDVTITRHSWRHLALVVLKSDSTLTFGGFNATFRAVEPQNAGNPICMHENCPQCIKDEFIDLDITRYLFF